ncbi:hypothetical protein ABT124_40775 [Streptomyces sp. NPDC001982]|uniref:hypothetical protein n=1 Tax=Streptomyces sp. NPDC001982 TaxID=3154405 RepID=UPI003323AFC3
MSTWANGRHSDVQDPEGTFVHYWLKNGQGGEHFRCEDIVFECFHSFLAFSQWGWTRATATRPSGRGSSGR